MKHEVHLFLGSASATAQNESNYPTGERRPLLVFMRQEKGTEPEWERAESEIQEVGWEHIELNKSGLLDHESLGTMEQEKVDAYEDALQDGLVIWVYKPDAT